MNILGIGVDIVDNNRIKILIKKKLFINKIFTKKEVNHSKKLKNKVNYFSKRFAAKESLSKALGIGLKKNLNFNDIEILNDKNGKPFYVKSKKIDNLVFKLFKIEKYNLFLSISDEKDYSIAFTILQKNNV